MIVLLVIRQIAGELDTRGQDDAGQSVIYGDGAQHHGAGNEVEAQAA